MTPDLVAIAVIGCGRISGHHGRAIAASDGVRLAAVCDLVLHCSGDLEEMKAVAQGTGELSDEAAARLGRAEAMREKAGGEPPGGQQGDQQGDTLARLNDILEKVAPA